MRKNLVCLTLYIICTGLYFTSCSSTRHLNEGEYLLVKNEVTANRAEIPTQSEIIYLVKPVACHQTFGFFPWKAGIYQSALPKEGKKDSKFRQ